VESGEVARIRGLYGPQKGRKTDPFWCRIKVTVTRRERVYEQLEKEFSGDKGRFFSFFATGDKSGSLRPYRRIAELISQMQKDVDAERALPCYLDEQGSFSASLWEQRWSGKNSWEVWRELGKEHYE
jgi:hypothetical protein